MVEKNNLVVEWMEMRKGKRGSYGAATGLIVAGGSRDLLGAFAALLEIKRVKSSLSELYRNGITANTIARKSRRKHKKHNKTRKGSH